MVSSLGQCSFVEHTLKLFRSVVRGYGGGGVRTLGEGPVGLGGVLLGRSKTQSFVILEFYAGSSAREATAEGRRGLMGLEVSGGFGVMLCAPSSVFLLELAEKLRLFGFVVRPSVGTKNAAAVNGIYRSG